jgi:6-phosphogluconolactonase
MEPKLPRITLTVPAINKSRRILFYITGQTKLDVLKSAALSTDPYTTPIGAFLAQCPVAVEFVWAP